MKSRLFILTMTLITAFTALEAEIVEAGRFKELLRYLNKETLLLVDIDDTLLIPAQTLGTDVWFLARLAHHKERCSDHETALDRALAEWEAVRHLTEVKIVEEGTEELLAALQRDNMRVMGLTTQGLALATRTINQLHTLNIDLSKTAPSVGDHYFINGVQGVLYRRGILFTSGTAKGEALIKLFNLLDYHPKQVVFINDKESHLRDVERSLEEKGIAFVGLRYAYSDKRVASFNKKLAEIQWNYSTFSHLLSDEEASLLLERNSCLLQRP